MAAAGLALLACALDASALSSGPARGTPLIGRALQISIPVTWERSDGPPCVRAEFLQGESPGGPLRWRLDQTSDTSGLLRLSSSLPVQEPMLTVQIALGCGQQYAREYVLLAEPPNEMRDAQAASEAGRELPVALAPLALAPATSLGGATPADTRAAPAARSPEAAPAAGSAPAPAAAPRPHRPQRTHSASAAKPAPKAAATPRHESAPKVAAAKPQAPAKPSGPRLKLEPIDVAIDEAPVLRLSNTLSPAQAAAGGTTLAAGAAAAPLADPKGVWQALNTSPEQQAAQAEAARAVEAELKAMRELVQRYGAESRATSQRLEKVSGERDLMLNILLGLVLLLGAGLAYLLWLRSRESAVLRQWWDEEHGGSARAEKAAAAAPAREAAAAAAPPVSTVPLPTGDVQPPPRTVATPADASESDLVDLPDFLEFDHGRVPTAEELLGLKERADFFLAVGQPEKAVQLLESQLHEHTGNSPFVWLDLLDLCRRLERREDYERLRIAFQKLFTARMPAFDAAMPESGGLEDHPRALSRITQLWGTPRVLKVIEDSLFEDPKPGSITFDLEASRDLLLLYGIATEAMATTPRENFGASFPPTVRSPLGAPETEPVPLAALDNMNWPPSLMPEPAAAGVAAAAAVAAPEPEPSLVPGLEEWVVSSLQPDAPASAPVPVAPAVATEVAAAPDIDLAELNQPLLPEDLDFSLSPAPKPGRTR